MHICTKIIFGGLLLAVACEIALCQASPAGNYSLIRDAAEALANGDLAKAEVELQTVLRTDPADYRALNFLGIVRAQQGRNHEAEDLFHQAIQRKPDFASAHVSLGMLYIQMNRPADAVAELQHALKLDPGRSDALAPLLNVLRSQARDAIKAGDPEKALALLIQARSAASKDPGVLFDFGMVALRMSLFPDAVQAFQDLLAERKDDPTALYALGRAQIGLSKFQEAYASFERYVQLRPTDASGFYALGVILTALQKNAEARVQFEQSVKLQPQQTEAYSKLGLLDLEDNQLDDAARQFEQVLKHNPSHAEALAGMGELEFRRKNYTVASDLLQRSIAGDSSLREAHYYLGLTYARLGRAADSSSELQKATELDREDLDRHRTIFRLLTPEEAAAAEAEQNKPEPTKP